MPDRPAVDIPDPRFPGIREQIAGYNMLVQERTEKLIKLFSRAEIPVTLLKGIALLQDVYEDLSGRILNDVDLLVRSEDFEKSKKILLEAGFTFEGTNFSNAEVYKINNRPDVFLDLHRHLFNHASPAQKRAYSPDESAVWRRALPVNFGSVKALVLRPEDRIVYLCFHLLKERFSDHKWLRDISLLARKKRNEINEEELYGTAKECGTLKLCSFVSDYLNVTSTERIEFFPTTHPGKEFFLYSEESALFSFLLKRKFHPLRELLWILAMDSGGKRCGFLKDLFSYIPEKVFKKSLKRKT